MIKNAVPKPIVANQITPDLAQYEKYANFYHYVFYTNGIPMDFAGFQQSIYWAHYIKLLCKIV